MTAQRRRSNMPRQIDKYRNLHKDRKEFQIRSQE